LKVEGVSFTSTAQMMQALVSGKIDATAAGSIEVIAEAELNSPNSIRIFNTLVFNKTSPFFSIIIPVNSNINSIKDLKNKKIGVLPGTTAVIFLKACVSNFFSPDSIKIEQLELRIQLQALSLGQVDALYTVDPIVSLATNKNIGKILIKGPENTYIMNPMATGGSVFSVKFFNEKRKTALKFIAAMDETIDIMRADELNTRKVVAKYTNLDQNIAASISLIDYWKLDETDFSHVQKYLDFLYSQKILSSPISAKDLYLKY
jgi:ABC-type nitrate/sulfonate/bicarbonate transport system substrate-binding protein